MKSISEDTCVVGGHVARSDGSADVARSDGSDVDRYICTHGRQAGERMPACTFCRLRFECDARERVLSTATADVPLIVHR